MSTSDIHRLLAERYSGGEWVYLTEVPDGTGMVKCRTADALAIGCWAKTHRRLIGFEIKASRSDWKKECEQPEKSLGWRKLCSEWYLVAANGVAKLEEIPADWGFMEVSKNGDKLLTRRMSPTTEHGEITVNMLAAITRRALAQIPEDTLQKVRESTEQYRKGYADATKNAEKALQSAIERDRETAEKTRNTLAALGLNSYSCIEHDSTVAKLFRSIQQSGITEDFRWTTSRLRRLRDESQGAWKQLDSFINRIEQAVEDIEKARTCQEEAVPSETSDAT